MIAVRTFDIFFRNPAKYVVENTFSRNEVNKGAIDCMTALMIVMCALWLSRDAIACLFMFKNVNEHAYHENVCLFAYLTVRLVLMIWMIMQMKVC